MIESMKGSRHLQSQSASLWSKAQYLFCALTTLAVLLMVMPVSMALTAGIASTSVVLFGIAALVLAGLLVTRAAASRSLVAVTLGIALLGLLVPQVALFRAANRVDAAIRFEPVTYMTFSGDTTIPSSKIMAYKTSSGSPLELALYEAASPGPRPTVVLLHGGGWRYGSHLETGDWPRLLTAAGFTVLSVEYRLSSDTYHTWRDAPADVHDALAYIRDNAAELLVDPERLNLLGQSAGGHLALLEAHRSQMVASVVALYAPIDLVLDYKTSRDKSAELDFIGGPPGQYPDRYEALSPSTYIASESPPTLLVQGISDDLVAPANAQRFSALLTEHKIEHDLLLLPLTGHSFENQRGGFATQIATQHVLNFLTRSR